MSDMESRLRALIVEQLGVEPVRITADATFWADLGADSLDTVELIMSVEDEFGVEISDDDADAAAGPEGTFGKLCALVERLAAKVEG